MSLSLLAALLLPPAGVQDREVLAFVSDRDGNREIYLVVGSKAVNLTRNPAEDWYPEWSPDFRKMTFTSSRDGGWDIYVMDLEGTTVTRLTHGEGWNGRAGWSPGGKRIAFHTSRDENWEIYLMNPDGKELRNLTRSEAHERMPVWSPDGKRIAFETDRDGDSEVYVMDADGKNARNISKHGAEDMGPSWSPDGKRLAFHSDRNGKVQIHVTSLDGEGIARISDNSSNDMHPVWTPDGKKIAFHSDRDGDWDVYVMNADGSGVRNVTDSDANDSWSPVSFGRIGPIAAAPGDPASAGRSVAALVRGWKGKATLGLLREAILPTIASGGAAFNKGDVAGCAKLYRETATRLTKAFGKGTATEAAAEALADLRAGLRRAENATSPNGQAWALRFAFDQTLLAWTIRNAHAKSLVRLGDQYFSISRYAECEAAFAQAAGILPELLGKDPDKVETTCRLAPFALANARFARGRFGTAVKAILQGLKGMPKWSEAKLNVRKLHRRPEEYDRRLAELEKAIQDHPDRADFRFLLGYAYHFTDRKDAAREHFDKALELAPDHPGARAFPRGRTLKGQEF